MVDRWELEWWCQEYPELPEDEILEVLREFEEDQINTEKTD
jgi:hypothetical protein